MRLIDADELLKELESNKLQPTKDTDGFIDGWCEGFNTVVDMIRNQPTAFETEKVIEQLEETRKTALNKVKMPIMIVCKHDLQEFADICFEESIDIVKKGGVE